jgi:two-component system, response regulator YesN
MQISNCFLVVDDEEMLRDLYSSFLAKIFPGCSIKTAKNGKEAMEIITGGFIPDMIVCDIRMPKMGGIELYLHLAKTGFFGSWLFTTGTLLEREQQFIFENELPCLEKPFSFDDFRGAIDLSLEGE